MHGSLQLDTDVIRSAKTRSKTWMNGYRPVAWRTAEACKLVR